MLPHSGMTVFECTRRDVLPIETAAAFRVAATQVISVDNSLFAAIALAAPPRPAAAVIRPCQHDQASKTLFHEIDELARGASARSRLTIPQSMSEHRAFCAAVAAAKPKNRTPTRSLRVNRENGPAAKTFSNEVGERDSGGHGAGLRLQQSRSSAKWQSV
jgi:hypothetical protein